MGYRYYRNDWQKVLNTKLIRSGVKSSNAEKIIGEISSAFPGKQNIHELIYDLQIKLKPYTHWDEPGFREMINAFIVEESEKKCSIHLSEEDLRVLWL
jgi:nicotinamide riboside kinase